MPKSLSQGKTFKSFSGMQERIMWDNDLHNALGTNQVCSPVSLSDFRYTDVLLAGAGGWGGTENYDSCFNFFLMTSR